MLHGPGVSLQYIQGFFKPERGISSGRFQPFQIPQDNRQGRAQVMADVLDLLLELPAMSLIAIASLVLANVLLEVFDKSIVSILVWLAVLVFLPKILLLAGMALTTASSTLLLDIALWMPANFLTAQSRVNMSECVAIWDTAQGMAKCLIAGGAEIVVFGALGVVLLRKREL